MENKLDRRMFLNYNESSWMGKRNNHQYGKVLYVSQTPNSEWAEKDETEKINMRQKKTNNKYNQTN